LEDAHKGLRYGVLSCHFFRVAKEGTAPESPNLV
jgi:hypothetical protein